MLELMLKNVESEHFSKEEIFEIYNESIKDWKDGKIRDYFQYSEELQIISEDKKKLVFEDLFNERVVPIRKYGQFSPMNFFEFGELKVDKKKFERIINLIPEELFMSTGKIVFISSKKELDSAFRRFDIDSDTIERFHEDLIGVNLGAKNIVLVNVMQIRKELIQMKKDYSFIMSFDEDFEFCRGIFTTIAHELRHQMQSNPMFPNIFEYLDHEEDAEDFSNDFFRKLDDDGIDFHFARM